MTLKRVREYIADHRLIAAGDLVVAGVSGGPDSVALLHMLLQLQEALGFRVHAAHLHHGLRDEADRDQELVESVCREWGVPLSWRRVDVARMAGEKKMSVEEAGREVRYRFLEDVRREIGGHKIATAHHRGDQAETILLHLIQGTGATGLQGILPLRDRIIRPLLDLSKTEIMDYLEYHRLPYRIDSSNFDNNYLRNRIRLELLPFLEQRFNPGMVDVLCRLAAVMREENRYWDELVAEVMHEVVQEGEEGPLTVRADRLQPMPLALKRRLIYRILQQAGGRRVSWDDVERVIDLLSQPESGRRVPVSGGRWVRRSYEVLEFGIEESAPVDFCYELPVPGRIEIKEIGLLVSARLLSEPPAAAADEVAVFDWEALKKPLFIRSRRPGDTFRPLGLGGSQKLKKYLIDKKIPRQQRERIAILAADDEIYWVIGHRQDERGKVGPGTRKILEVRASHVDK
ncbi:MAG: tRNA lysidine(34) synthetase TilS [Syntrophomonadaceae bacterium]|nr:tRNA lysidine(34) synthetase TilS [Syntrophomonadaceae bacterium]